MTDAEFAQFKMITNERIMELSEEVSVLRELFESMMQQPAQAGTFPPLAEIEKLQVQIFHTLDLTADQKRGGRSEWSLKIEQWHRGRKQPGIDIGLVAPAEFLKHLQRRNAPPAICRIAEQMSDPMLGGLVRRKMTNGGRTYVPSQAVVLDGYLIGQVVVVLMIDDEQVLISNFTDAKGSKKGSAIWFAKWSR